MNTFEAINKRRSVRSYTDERIDENDLEKIIETGKIAPVAAGFQITVVQNKEVLDKLSNGIKKFLKASDDENRRAMAENPNFNGLYGANTLVLFSAPDENPFGDIDTALAAENIILASTDLDLATCYMITPVVVLKSPGNEDLLKQLELPKGFKPIGAVIIGKESSDSQKPERIDKNNVNYVK